MIHGQKTSKKRLHVGSHAYSLFLGSTYLKAFSKICRYPTHCVCSITRHFTFRQTRISEFLWSETF